MNWRRFPLPLLLLTVTLSPTEASRAWQSAGIARVGHGPNQTAEPAPMTGAGQRRRRESTPDSTEISGESLRLVSDYLQSRSSNVAPAPELARAWDQFHRSCDAIIRRFAASMGLRGADVDDCTQEVWIDLLGRLPTFQLDASKGRFGSWLFRVVQSKAANLRRSQSRMAAAADALAMEKPGDASGDPADVCERAAECDLVRSALSDLKKRSSEQSYRVLFLRHMEGRRVDEVAEELGLTPAQVWARECRMKQKLRSLIEEAA